MVFCTVKVKSRRDNRATGRGGRGREGEGGESEYDVSDKRCKVHFTPTPPLLPYYQLNTPFYRTDPLKTHNLFYIIREVLIIGGAKSVHFLDKDKNR